MRARPRSETSRGEGAHQVFFVWLFFCFVFFTRGAPVRGSEPRMKSRSQEQSLSDSRELDRSYDPLTGRLLTPTLQLATQPCHEFFSSARNNHRFVFLVLCLPLFVLLNNSCVCFYCKNVKFGAENLCDPK